MDDAALLAGCPDYISLGAMLKATPQGDGGRRFVYFEASKEELDQQNEVVLAKALADSAGFFLRYGNIDIDHYTVIGAKLGIPNYPSYEIGRPVEVGQHGGQTFVKSELFTGDGPMAEKANMVWSSLTELNPPARWYPSVGGQVLSKSIVIDKETHARKTVVGKVRWSNIGISKTPVNQHVGACATVPVGVFAKSMVAGDVGSFDLGAVMKTLTAGYGSDSAGLEGGAALREQSLDRGIASYWDFRERMAAAVRDQMVGPNPDAKSMAAFAVAQFGLSHDESAKYVGRFLRDLGTSLKQRRTAQ